MFGRQLADSSSSSGDKDPQQFVNTQVEEMIAAEEQLLEMFSWTLEQKSKNSK